MYHSIFRRHWRGNIARGGVWRLKVYHCTIVLQRIMGVEDLE